MEKVCSECGGSLKHYSKAKRIIKSEYGKVNWILIDVGFCESCNRYYRILPDILMRFKHYEARIIQGVISGEITNDILKYEDYPSESTMTRWLKEFTNDFDVTNEDN